MVRFNKLKIFFVVMLAMLAIVTVYAVSPTIAKFVTQEQEVSGAFVAKYVFESSLIEEPEEGEVAAKITVLDISGMQPGQVLNYDISIDNFSDSAICEVSQNYSMAINTTGNLPLVYSLVDANGEELFGDTNVTEDILLEGDTTITHEYKLTISWPSNLCDYDYMDEVDKVLFQINAYQIISK